MRLSEIEDYQLLATKEDIANLRAEFAKALLESERAQRFWIWGLYVIIIISHFWK